MGNVNKKYDEDYKKNIVKLDLAIFLILPLIIVGVVLANSHISFNFFLNDSSIGNHVLLYVYLSIWSA